MEFLQRVFINITLTAIFCMLIGLIKPWTMLWWEDVQNRRKVIKIYGGVALIFYTLYCGLLLF